MSDRLERVIDSLKAIAESSRFRILALLASSSLTVSDMTAILGQSQPRVSRHLKLLMEAGLIQRYQEGSWAYFHLSDNPFLRGLITELVAQVDSGDKVIERDRERLERIKEERRATAADYFSRNAESWDELRSLHVPDEAVEAALKDVVGNAPFQTMLDLGTGTGRLLELFAPQFVRGIGVDMSREMLAIARANFDRADLTNVQVRHGDIYAPPVDHEAFDLITIHQVLHYLDDPARAIGEAARLLRPGGRLVIVDFAPHGLEFLRDKHAHVRFGFSDEQIAGWLSEARLVAEAPRAFSSKGNDSEHLTVKLWSARDPRLLMADPAAHDTSQQTPSFSERA